MGLEMTRVAGSVVITLLTGVILFSGCGPNRGRPGPPRVNIDIESGTSVFSPDTFSVVFSAVDEDGLDSLNLRWGNLQFDVNTFFRTEVTETVELVVPDNISPGIQRSISVRAKDLFGQSTVEFLTVTIVARP